MITLTEKMYEQALDLPIDDRLLLIDKLLNSANPSIQYDIDNAWSEEVEFRCRELESGKAKLIPGEEVFDKIKNRYQDRLHLNVFRGIDKPCRKAGGAGKDNR